MNRLILFSVAFAAALAIAASSAFAKGASEALIVGPGLGDGIRLSGEGMTGADQLARIAEDAGFYPAVFATSPNPMLATRPSGDLGPRYTITYTMPGPDRALDELVQDLYPYAKPGPVTYVEPGQSYFGSEKAVGGWFVASEVLTSELIDAGLPSTPPSGADGFPSWTVSGALVAALAAIAAVLFVRRRPPRGQHGPALS